MINWIKEHKAEVFIVLIILFVGAFLRLFRISEYMTFLGDEGRDVIVVRRLLVYGDLILVGPGTSIGNMYLGPLYYYMMAPALLLANFSPVGPAVMVALLGVVTIGLVWWAGREWFGRWAGVFAAILYAISPVVIIYSRSSWNPNIMPFFALLSIYSIWAVWQRQSFRWLLVLAVSLAFVLNSHYLGLLLIPVVGMFWLLTFLSLLKVKIPFLSDNMWFGSYNLGSSSDKQLRPFIYYTIASLVVFVFLMSPIVIFDARHGWRNIEAMRVFFTERQTTVSARPWNALPKLWPNLVKISARLIGGENSLIGSWISILIVASIAWIAGAYKTHLAEREKPAYLLVIFWILIALVGLGLYKQEIYDHYYGFFFPALFILLGAVLDHAIEIARVRGWWLAITAMVILVYFNFLKNPLRYPPNRQLQRTVSVAEKIREESGGEKFNLAVIAERNYEDAYQYFLEQWSTGVVDIDPLRADETIMSQLFVVCELPEEECDPTHNPKAEVANFGWSRVEEKWEQDGVIIYKLIHR